MTIIALIALLQMVVYPHASYAAGNEYDPSESLIAVLNPNYSFSNERKQDIVQNTVTDRLMIDGAYIAVAQSIVTKTKETSVIAVHSKKPVCKPQKIQPSTRVVVVTAYSSTPDQTDSTPFITASGAHVYDGIIAANFLPFGAKVKFPEMYGDKVFIVEDRMARRFSDRMDIWFPDRESAITFGKQRLLVEILES